MEIVDFRNEHLEAVLRLCRQEGWRTLPSEPARALRVLAAPGSTVVVGEEAGVAHGFCQLLSDGEIQAFCSLLLVESRWRRRGAGRELLLEALRRAGGLRVDLLAAPAAVGFYRRLRHREWSGFRVYPDP